MKRIFEKKVPYLDSIERKIVTDDTVTTQYVNTLSLEELKKKYKMEKLLPSITEQNAIGFVWKESTSTITDIGWHTAKEFIRERIHGNYTEITT